MTQINPLLGFFHIPKTAGLYISGNVQNALSIPEISVHKIFGGNHVSENLHDLPDVGKQYLYLSEKGWTDVVLRSYPFYSGHLSIEALNATWRKNIFTYVSDPIKRALSLYRYMKSENPLSDDFNEFLDLVHLQIPRQFYGNPDLFEFDMHVFQSEFFEKISHVYAADDPSSVLNFLTRDFNLKFDPSFKDQIVNEYKEKNLIEKVHYSKKELYERLHEITWVDRSLIQVVESQFPENFLPTKVEYSFEEFEELVKKHEYLVLT